MRKILAGFLATSMVVSMSAMVSAAQTNVAANFTATVPQIEIDGTLTAGTTALTASQTGTWAADVTYNSVTMVLKDSASATIGTVNVPMDGKKETTPTKALATDNASPVAATATKLEVPAVDVAKHFTTQTVHDIRINGAYYSCTLTVDGTTLKVQFADGQGIPNLASVDWQINATVTNPRAMTVVTVPADATFTTTPDATTFQMNTGAPNGGSLKETIETEKDGNMIGVSVKDVLISDADGTPIPLTEKDTGVDKSLNASGGVQSGQTVYFMVRDDAGAAFDKLEDDSFWGMKISKSNNGKYIKSTDDVTKIFSSDLYDARQSSSKVPGTGGTRHRYIKVALNEIYTDDEYKISLDVRLTAKDPAVRTGIVTADATMLKVKDFSFWMKNIVKSADNDWTVGIQGLMLNPMLNDWNNVTYMDEVDDVAFVRFFGDSDVGKFYAKLSTKWTHDDYAAYFNDQDAFYFEFTGSPKISTTSRADLQIYDPFTDVDGNSTFDASTATIYQIVDGDLVDVTSSFTYGEGENGENAFITRTRFLGSYIICEKPVEEAVGEENIDDLMPGEEEIPVAPVTPDNNAGGKNPANTGRYA